MATFLVRALGLPAAAPSFVDLGSSVHAADVGALAAAGITRGCNPAEGNTRFCPKDAVTREQMATFLVRALGLPAASPSFVDVDGVHAADVGALAAAGITKGCNPGEGNTRFCPKDAVTREQMATFLTRALDLDTSPRVVVTPNQDLFGIELGTSETETVAAITALLGSPTEDDARLLAADAAASCAAIHGAIRTSRSRWGWVRWRCSLRSLRRGTRSPVAT